MIRFFFLALFFLVTLGTKSQTQGTSQKIKLEELLKRLEKKYDIRFSYNADVIKSEKIQAAKYEELDEAITAIQRQTNFFIQPLQDRYYLVNSKTENGTIIICGMLIDKTNIPIENALITNLTTNQRAFSDKKGVFELYLSHEKDNIKIAANGLSTVLYTANELAKIPCTTILLEEEYDEYLEEVLISQYIQTTEFNRGKDGNFSFDPNKIGALPNLAEPDILESLKVLPGIQSVSESATKLLIRGGNPDENAVFWDGIRMYDDGHLFGTLSSYNPYIVKEVKLYRGGTHPKYGNLTAGVIEITSANQVPEKISGSIGTSLNIADANIQAPISKKIGLFVSARRTYLDVFDTGVLRKYQERVFQNNTIVEESKLDLSQIRNNNTDFNFSDYTFKTIYAIQPKNQLELSFIHSFDKATYRNEIFEPVETSIPDVEEIRNIADIEAVIKKRNYGIGFNWNNAISKKFSYKLNTYYSNYEELSEEDNLNEVTVNNVVLGFINKLSNQISDIGIFFETKWKILKDLELHTGYDFSGIQISTEQAQSSIQILDETPVFSTGFSERFNDSHAFFYNLKFKFFNSFSGDIGARHSKFSNATDQNWSIEPRLALRYKWSNYFRTRVTFEEKNQVLSQINTTYDEIELSRNLWSINKQPLGFLPKRNSQQISLGFVYARNDFAIDFDVYQREVQNLPSFVEGLSELINPATTGKSSALGLDILAKKKFSNYNLILGYSWLQQDFTFPENNNAQLFNGSFDIKHSFSITQSFAFNQLEFALSWRYQSGIPFSNNVALKNLTNPNGEIIVTDFNNDRLNDFHKLDMNISYFFKPFKNDKIKIKAIASALNVYNRKNEIGVLYKPILVKENIDTGVREFELNNSAIQSLGFTPNIALRMMF